jgi:hypothetical protein
MFIFRLYYLFKIIFTTTIIVYIFDTKWKIVSFKIRIR